MNAKKLVLEENVGGYDLMIRAAAGTLAIIALAMDLAAYPWNLALAFVALIGLYTAMTRHCMPYALLGISTKEKG